MRLLPRRLLWIFAAFGLLASPGVAQETGADEAVAFFRLDAFLVREALREGGANVQAAERFWQAAQDFARIVGEESGEDKELFTPILQGMRATMAENILLPDTPDLAAVERIQQTLDEQIQINETAGLFWGGKSRVTVDVYALLNNVRRSGLTVWIDPPCCVRRVPAEALSQATTARTAVKPGTYIVRIVSSGRVVGCKRAQIGRTRPDKVDVEVTNANAACR